MIFWSKNVKMSNYIDTDSFIIEVIGENFDNIMLENKEFFYLSNFSRNIKYFCNDNKKVAGRWICWNLYFRICSTKTKIRHNNFKSSEFKDVVNDKNVFRHIMKKNHLKNMKYILKKAIKHISCFDNKR